MGTAESFLLGYLRGPEGLIVELAERLDGTPSWTTRLNHPGFGSPIERRTTDRTACRTDRHIDVQP